MSKFDLSRRPFWLRASAPHELQEGEGEGAWLGRAFSRGAR